MKQFADLINSLRTQKTFFRSPAFDAVYWMYDGDQKMTEKSELAYILLRLRHNREPSVQDMMDMIDREPEMHKQSFISAIVNECTRQGGAPVLESIILNHKIKINVETVQMLVSS